MALTTDPQSHSPKPLNLTGSFSLILLSFGLFVMATALPGSTYAGAISAIQKWIHDRGLPEIAVRVIEILYAYRLWIGAAITLVAGYCDERFGSERLTEILKDPLGVLKFASVGLQLALVVWICRSFQLEHDAFTGPFLFLVSVGFVIHFILPSSLRLSFFVLLSSLAILTVLGWQDGCWLIALSATLISIARSPITFYLRVIGLFAVTLGLTFARAYAVNTPWSDAIWPLLWSMFLFRMIIYMFDIKHGKVPTGWTHALAYFLMLPNVVFPLFPPVDYQGLWRSYYQKDQFRGYQTGIHWMLVGIVHLLVYRYIDYYWIEATETIMNSRSLIQYVIASYLLIIRLSGQFHLIVGILHLFGFQLPRCMDHYFLATGFTDYWRRVNIYWKEFIQKVIYYPAFFRMRRFSNTTKLIVATCLGFLATWFFHSCQWFGLRGAWVLSSTDVFFWCSLAVLVLVGSLLENRFGRKRSLARKQASISEICVLGLKSTGVFVVMAILWSIWISSSFSSWWNLVSRSQLSWIDVSVTLLVIAGTLCTIILIRDRWSATLFARPERFSSDVLYTYAPLMALSILGSPFAVELLTPQAKSMLAELQVSRLNQKHESIQLQGYYEQLNDINDFNFRLYEIYSQKSQRALIKGGVDPIAVNNIIEPGDLKLDKYGESNYLPNLDVVIWNHPFRTNQWGMRDRDYPLEPPPRSRRIALMGGSISLGRGVSAEDTYESLLEATLNKDHLGNGIERFELLNFSVGAHGVFQRLTMLEHTALPFKPSIVFFTCHVDDPNLDLKHLGRMDRKRVPYPEIIDLLSSAGVTEGMAAEEVRARLFPIWEELSSVYYKKAVEVCHGMGIKIAMIVIPSKPGERALDRISQMLEIGREAGFDAVINLTGAYKGYTRKELHVSEDDGHPSATAHRLLYERLYQELLGPSGEVIGLFQAPAPNAVIEKPRNEP